MSSAEAAIIGKVAGKRDRPQSLAIADPRSDALVILIMGASEKASDITLRRTIKEVRDTVSLAFDLARATRNPASIGVAGTICAVVRTLGARLLKVCGEGAMNDAIIELCRMNDDGDADALGHTWKEIA